MKVIESILKAVLEADEENPMELMGPKDMPKVELFSPTNPGGPMTAPHRVALHVGMGNRNEWVVHYEDMSGGQSHGYYQGFYTYNYAEALEEFKERCKKIGVDPAQSEQHLAEALDDVDPKEMSGPQSIGDWLVGLGFAEEAGWNKKTRSYSKYAAPNERWIIWPNLMDTRQVAGWYSIDHEFKTPRGWEKADHRFTLNGDEELQKFVRMLSCVREAAEDDMAGEWKELVPVTSADEILQYMPPEFVRAYQMGEQAEWENPHPDAYDWQPVYDDDLDDEDDPESNPFREVTYYPEYRTEGGKIFEVWKSVDKDGDHDYEDEAEVGTPDADRLQKIYGPDGYFDEMKRYWEWVVARRRDPLGYIFTPTVEVEKKWIASFARDGERLRCTAIRRLGVGKGKVDLAKALELAQQDEDWKKAIEYLMLDAQGYTEADMEDIIREGGKWNAQGLLIIDFNWTDKEAAANQEQFIVQKAQEALNDILKDERKRKRRQARRKKRGIQDALEDELMGAGENELADLLLNTVDGQTLRFKFIHSYPDQSPLGPTTAVQVSIEGGQVLGTVYPGTYVQHHPEALGDTIHIYGILVSKDNAMILSNWVKERLAMWNELGEALEDDFDVKDVAGGGPLENVLVKAGFYKDQWGHWIKDLTGNNKIEIQKLGEPDDPNTKNWHWQSTIAGQVFGPYLYSEQDAISQLIHGGYVGQEDVAEWHWSRAWLPHPQGGKYEPKGRKYWESEEDYKDLMPDPPIDHWLANAGFKQLNEVTWMKSFDAQGRSRAMVWKHADGLYELKSFFENYEFRQLRTKGTEKDILAALERMTINSPGLWPKNWREESLSPLAKQAIKERLAEAAEEGEWKELMSPSAEEALQQRRFKFQVTKVFPNGVWVRQRPDQGGTKQWYQAEQRGPDRWNLASFSDFTCIASRDLSGAQLARELSQWSLEEAEEGEEWKDLVHEVQVERWVFTNWELKHPETCRRDDEFLTAESYDPYGMGILMYRDGNATNRTADGTAGVDKEAKEWANDQETYIKDKHSREDQEEDMFASTWRDVFATWNGKFAGWVKQEPPQVVESERELTPLLPELVQAAQEAYDAWSQDEQGEDPELGVGGICQDVAEAMSGVLNGHGIDASTVDNQGMGDQHVWVVAKLSDGVYVVDIPPGVYETGSGYVWKKRPGVVFSPEHILVDRIDSDPAKFEQYIGESEDDDLIKDVLTPPIDFDRWLKEHGFYKLVNNTNYLFDFKNGGGLEVYPSTKEAENWYVSVYLYNPDDRTDEWYGLPMELIPKLLTIPQVARFEKRKKRVVETAEEDWKELVHSELHRPTLLTQVPVGWHFRDIDGIEKIKDAETDRKTNNPLYTVYPVPWTLAQIKSYGRHRSKLSESEEDDWKELAGSSVEDLLVKAGFIPMDQAAQKWAWGDWFSQRQINFDWAKRTHTLSSQNREWFGVKVMDGGTSFYFANMTNSFTNSQGTYNYQDFVNLLLRIIEDNKKFPLDAMDNPPEEPPVQENDEDAGGWKEVMSEPWQQMIQDGGWKLISFKKRHWVPLVMRRIKDGKRQLIQWSPEDRGYRLTVDGLGVIEGRLIDCLQTAEKMGAPKE